MSNERTLRGCWNLYFYFVKRCIIFVLLFAVAAVGCEQSTAPNARGPDQTQGNQPPLPAPKPKPPLPPPAEATLLAVGDVMMHTPQLPGAYDEKSKTYDFSGFFRPVRSMISEADWAVVNLETPIAGDEQGFKGYPRFNAPVALADALADAGFTIITTANNHSLDQGAKGLEHTLHILKEKGLIPVGTAESEEASRAIPIVEKSGIKNAFLAYTYGTNGIPVPKDKPYAVNLIEESKIVNDIARARNEGADIVTVSLHFGNEYERKPNDTQRRIAKLCIEAGADVVIGHHPHVVQPYEMVHVTRNDGTSREGLIMYSLGNFISNQFGDYKEYGAILTVRFLKTYEDEHTSSVTIAGVEAIPTWVHKYASGGKYRYRILPLEELFEKSDDPLLTPKLLAALSEKAVEMNKHLQSLTIEAGTKTAAQ